jgi:hypothetical protein
MLLVDHAIGPCRRKPGGVQKSSGRGKNLSTYVAKASTYVAENAFLPLFEGDFTRRGW